MAFSNILSYMSRRQMERYDDGPLISDTSTEHNSFYDVRLKLSGLALIEN